MSKVSTGRVRPLRSLQGGAPTSRYVTAGSTCQIVVEKITVRIVPTTNSGMAARINEISDDDVSNFLSRRSAALAPIIIESGIDPTAAINKRKNEAPIRGLMYSPTGVMVA